MVDLHMHSTHSDGTDSPIELLKKAEEIGLEIMSITDHDKVDAHIELENINIRDYYRGILIKGVELKTIYNSIPIEILAYGIDAIKTKKLINHRTEAQKKVQIKYLEYIKNTAKKIGLKFNENIQIDDAHPYASAAFASVIDKTGVNEEIIQKYNISLDASTFYRNCQSNPSSIFYIDESDDCVSPQEIINEIHGAGGLAFLAHPIIYPFKDIWETIEEFVKKYNIDGLECYHSLFTAEESEKLIEICNKYNLYKSGGSDYHGLNKPDINMGTGKGNLNILSELVNEWISEIN